MGALQQLVLPVLTAAARPPCFDGGLNRSFSLLDFIHDRLWYPDPSRRSSGQSYSMQWQVSPHQVHCSERAVLLYRSLLVFPLEGGRRGCSSTRPSDHVGAFRSGCVGDIRLESYGDYCATAFEKSFSRILEFQQLCTIHNTIFFFLYLIHEAYLGERMQADYTLFVELAGCGGKTMNDYPYAL